MLSFLYLLYILKITVHYILQDEAVFSPITTLTAKDKDESDASRLKYSFHLVSQNGI